MSTDLAELEERRLQALRDLTELEDQIEAGEIDAVTGDRLRRIYEADAADAIDALATARERAERAERGEGAPDADETSASRPRALLTAGIVVVALVAGGVLLADQLAPRPEGGFVTGNLPEIGAQDVSIDEMEAAVAANPDVVPMRLALADRHFEAGDIDAAYAHYWEALQRANEPDPHALTRVGWIVAGKGELELGAQLIEESLERRPDHPESLFLLASIHLELGDAERAELLLRRALDANELAPEDEQLIHERLAELEATGGGR